MLAHRLVTVLPDLDADAQLEVASVHGVAGGDRAIPSPRPPVRAPQAGLTAAALIGGGGGSARPGELSLAHRGVLVLDELLETPRPVLDALRQPLESGRVVIDRARLRVALPAHVQLVATTNPCPCGMLGHPRRPCTCRPDRIERYRGRLSGPLLDRIDVHVVLQPVPRERLTGPPEGTRVRSSPPASAPPGPGRSRGRVRSSTATWPARSCGAVRRTPPAGCSRTGSRRSARPRVPMTAACASRSPSRTSTGPSASRRTTSRRRWGCG